MPQLIEHLDEFLRGIIPQDVHSRDWEITEKYKVSYLYVLLAQRLIGQLVGSAFFLYEIYYSGGSMDEFFKLIFRGVAFSFTTYFSLNFLLRSKYHQFAMIFFCIWNFVTVFLGGLFMGQELGVMLSAGHVICIPFILFGSDHIHFPLMNCCLVISITLARHYYVVSNSMSFVFDLHSGFTINLHILVLLNLIWCIIFATHQAWLITKQLKGTIQQLQSEVNKSNESRKELEAQQEQTESALRVRTLLLSNFSHEIRTPLGSILSIIQLLHDANLTEIQKHYVNLMDRAASSLLGLLKNIIDASRLHSNSMVSYHEQLDILSTFYPLVCVGSFTAHEKRLEVLYNVDAELREIGLIFSDKNIISSIIYHLLSNAIKFTQGGPENFISFRASLVDQNFPFPNDEFVGAVSDIRFGCCEQNSEHKPRLLYIQIQDTGCGMNSDMLKSIGNPFSKGKHVHHHSGLGLGISVVKKLCDLVHGICGCRSEENAGSIFWCAIPTCISSSINIKESCNSEEQVYSTFQNLSEMINDEVAIPFFRILIIQNHPRLMESMCLMVMQLFPNAVIFCFDSVFDIDSLQIYLQFKSDPHAKLPSFFRSFNNKNHSKSVKYHDIIIMDIESCLKEDNYSSNEVNYKDEFQFDNTWSNAEIFRDNSLKNVNLTYSREKGMMNASQRPPSSDKWKSRFLFADYIQAETRGPVILLCPLAATQVALNINLSILPKPVHEQMLKDCLLNSRNFNSSLALDNTFLKTNKDDVVNLPPIKDLQVDKVDCLTPGLHASLSLHNVIGNSPFTSTNSDVISNKSTNPRSIDILTVTTLTSPECRRTSLKSSLQSSINLASMRVLFAEDHPLNQKVIMKQLKNMGLVNVDLVNDGDLAVQKLIDNPGVYDWCLLDYQMPRMNGDIVAHKIRNELGLKIPLIALTACAIEDVEKQFRSAGVNHILMKPLRLDELICCLNSIFSS